MFDLIYYYFFIDFFIGYVLFPEEYHYFQKVINDLVFISSIIFMFFSNKVIQKDYALIKLMNRIR